MLEFRNITKTFSAGTPDENTLFKNFGMEVPTGQFVSIIGSNGSGKTTLLNLLAGALIPEAGKILLGGEDISKQPEHVRARRIGRVFQDPALGTAASLTVLENLSIAANKGRSYGLTRGIPKEAPLRFQELLAPLGMGLEHRLHQRCGTLSGGQRQALALLMSTLAQPDILILDEHTAALDPKSSETVMRLTEQLVSQTHFTVLMVTHNLRHALEYGDRLYMMHEGRAVLDVTGPAKAQVHLEDVLDLFNKISIELGNSV